MVGEGGKNMAKDIKLCFSKNDFIFLMSTFRQLLIILAKIIGHATFSEGGEGQMSVKEARTDIFKTKTWIFGSSGILHSKPQCPLTTLTYVLRVWGGG